MALSSSWCEWCEVISMDLWKYCSISIANWLCHHKCPENAAVLHWHDFSLPSVYWRWKSIVLFHHDIMILWWKNCVFLSSINLSVHLYLQMADNEGEGGGVVGVIFGCRDNLDMCICNPCCGDNVINHLSTIQGFEVISNNSHRIGSIQNLDDFRDLKKIVFVWNGCTYFAKRLLEYAKVAQLDKESGNFIIHIRIDGNSCLPEESKKWDKVITYTCDMKAGSGFLDTIKQDLEGECVDCYNMYNLLRPRDAYMHH